MNERGKNIDKATQNNESKHNLFVSFSEVFCCKPVDQKEHIEIVNAFGFTSF